MIVGRIIGESDQDMRQMNSRVRIIKQVAEQVCGVSATGGSQSLTAQVHM